MKVFKKILWILTAVMLAVNIIPTVGIVLTGMFALELPDWIEIIMMCFLAVNVMYGGMFVILALIIAVVFIICFELKKHDVQKSSVRLLLRLFLCSVLWSVQLGMGFMSV